MIFTLIALLLDSWIHLREISGWISISWFLFKASCCIPKPSLQNPGGHISSSLPLPIANSLIHWPSPWNPGRVGFRLDGAWLSPHASPMDHPCEIWCQTSHSWSLLEATRRIHGSSLRNPNESDSIFMSLLQGSFPYSWTIRARSRVSDFAFRPCVSLSLIVHSTGYWQLLSVRWEVILPRHATMKWHCPTLQEQFHVCTMLGHFRPSRCRAWSGSYCYGKNQGIDGSDHEPWKIAIGKVANIFWCIVPKWSTD